MSSLGGSLDFRHSTIGPPKSTTEIHWELLV